MTETSTDPHSDAAYLAQRQEDLSGGDLTDRQVADQVRMLMRGDLNHEAVCVTARDRIRWLSARLAARLAAAEARQPDPRSAALERVAEAAGRFVDGFERADNTHQEAACVASLKATVTHFRTCFPSPTTSGTGV